MANPGISLVELGQMMHPPVGKSGVNHRLQRLLAMADEAEQDAITSADETEELL